MTVLGRSLFDDPIVLNVFLVVAATLFAVALTSCLWHHLHQHPDEHPSILSAALASFHFSVARSVPVTSQQQPLSVSVPTVEQRDRKSTRSKERRRRGKDPLRDIFKGGKKSKALLKAVKVADNDHSPPSTDTPSNSSTPQNDTASLTSRSQSPASELLDMDHPVPRLLVESDDGSARCTTPNDSSSASEAVTSAVDSSDHGPSSAASQPGSFCTSSLLDSITATDTEVNISSASTTIAHASEDTISSPPSPTACADVRTPQSRDSQATYTSGSCANLVRARTKLRLSRMDPSVKSSLLLSSTSPPLPDSVATPFNSILPCPSSSLIPSTYSTDGAGPSTPTNSRGSTPPSRSLSVPEVPDQREHTQPLDQRTAPTHIQLASMRTALEAARIREEQLRAEAEQVTKERDELRWGWNEDASAWRRREAELQAQINHLMQQLQAYAAVASYQVQQAPSAFSSPTSTHGHMSPRLQHHPLVPFPLPPPIQTQNSASAPAHVQSLLASAPMLTSHPPGFTTPFGGLYPGASFGMSPLLWSGLGLCAPNRDARLTPDSSASGSTSRDRRRRECGENAASVSDESTLGDWDGIEDGSGDEDTWEEEEDIFKNNVLADAILKRPESIRGLSKVGKRSGGRPPMHWNGVGERIDALKDPALDKPGFVAPLADIPAIKQ